MPQLPRIQSPKPVTLPAVDEQQYPDAFVTQLTIRAMPGEAWKSAIQLTPFNFDTGKVGPSDRGIRIELDDIRAFAERRAAAGDPALLQALGAVTGQVATLLADPEIAGLEQDGVIEIKEPTPETESE